ncbi:MAG: hypothetical protein IPG83_13395 [Novosphingobium sp.]|nr:hypothetical protein [Novosphingobium sp.]
MRQFAAALALLAAVPAAAQDAAAPPQPWEGVWQGTIGTYPVRLCLSQRSDSWSVGAYYYLSQLKTIGLDRRDDGSWVEKAGSSDAVTGRWTLRPAGDSLAGEWQQGAKVLPLALTRVAADITDGACGTREFLAPRIQPVKLREAPKTLARFAYRELTWDVGRGFPEVSLTSFAYSPVASGDKAILAALRLDPARPEGEADYVSCFQGALGSLGKDGDFSFGYAPRAVSAAFVSVTASAGGFCGGAHPYADYWWLTFDRKTGKKVDLGTWLTPAAVPRGDWFEDSSLRPLSPAFKRLVLRRLRFEDSECRTVVSEAELWNIGLDRTGLVFSPSLPHVAQACGDDAAVPFAELGPWLSAAGKAGAARQKGG